MKLPLALFCLLFAVAAPAEVITASPKPEEGIPLTAAQASALHSYDVQELEAQATALNSDLVKVKFTYRAADTTLQDDGTIKGTLGYSTTNLSSGAVRAGSMAVVVPKLARPWFLKVTTVATSRKPLFAYGRVKIEEGVTSLELVGRELKMELKGPRIVWDLEPRH